MHFVLDAGVAVHDVRAACARMRGKDGLWCACAVAFGMCGVHVMLCAAVMDTGVMWCALLVLVVLGDNSLYALRALCFCGGALQNALCA